MSNEIKHERRKRYSGTHPKSFALKYKEQNPDKYPETIDKVIQKGSTPAGMHLSICMDEILSFLDIKEGQVGIDCTLGYGGHSLAILKKLNHSGMLYSFDVDPIEMPKTKERIEKQGFYDQDITYVLKNFKDIDMIGLSQNSVDFIIADLGVSSMQIDDPQRGFSYKVDGPLDLRMDPSTNSPANLLLQNMTYDEIKTLLIENSDEVYADEIASMIIKKRQLSIGIHSTQDFYNTIKEALSFLPENIKKDEIKKASQRSFQALRIEVNRELESLYILLEKIPTLLKSGGKVAILSFHSGEDRLVKKAFQYFHRLGIYETISDGPIRPSLDEIKMNGRAKSAKLRWAIKK